MSPGVCSTTKAGSKPAGSRRAVLRAPPSPCHSRSSLEEILLFSDTCGPSRSPSYTRGRPRGRHSAAPHGTGRGCHAGARALEGQTGGGSAGACSWGCGAAPTAPEEICRPEMLRGKVPPARARGPGRVTRNTKGTAQEVILNLIVPLCFVHCLWGCPGDLPVLLPGGNQQ